MWKQAAISTELELGSGTSNKLHFSYSDKGKNMLAYNFSYGIVLSDGFSTYDDVMQEIDKLVKENEGNYPNWLVSFHFSDNHPKPQLVLGINIEVNKNMDFKAIHEEWEQSMKSVPQNILDMVVAHTSEEPDIHLLAGIFND